MVTFSKLSNTNVDNVRRSTFVFSVSVSSGGDHGFTLPAVQFCSGIIIFCRFIGIFFGNIKPDIVLAVGGDNVNSTMAGIEISR